MSKKIKLNITGNNIGLVFILKSNHLKYNLVKNSQNSHAGTFVGNLVEPERTSGVGA